MIDMETLLLEPVINVGMTAEDAALFLDFQQNYTNVKKLLTARTFDIRNGCAVLHLDGIGNVRKIERHDNLYVS